MLNKRQIAALSSFFLRAAEILFAGGFVYGIMQPVKQWGLITATIVLIPWCMFIGVLLLWSEE